jgi:hypothetical protein
VDEQRLRARRQGRQAAPGRLRVLAQPAHPRPVVPHPQLPRLRRRARPDRRRGHLRHPRRQAVAAATRRHGNGLKRSPRTPLNGHAALAMTRDGRLS